MFMSKIDAFNQLIGVQKVGLDNIDLLNERFFPTLFQNEIEKAFELRIVYIKNHFFAMAIFSQNDEKTKIDYRNYNRQKPNRTIPYTLPQDIVVKLQHLMNQLELDSGSIDMIVTNTNEYVFLEVNPTGQLGWVSEHCNYYLEQKIAYYLQHGAIIYE
jgi:glutathione synthase/RimK-type ligase-like ATP-grasp enzyme